MNNTFRLLIALILISLNHSYSQTTESTNGLGKLTVIIRGFEEQIGNCRFALSNSEELFEREDTVWIGQDIPVKSKEIVITIDSLKFGEYAVKVFHDENEDKEIDTNILGIPTEDYGYSNDASLCFGTSS